MRFILMAMFDMSIKRTVRNIPSLQKEVSNIGWDINHLQLFVFLYQELKNMPIEDDVAKCDTITI